MKRFVFILTVISFFIGSALASGFKIVNGPTGNCYLLETTNHQVVKINSSNRVLYAYGGSEKFLSPQGIVVNNEKIFIADTGNKRVVELIDDGTAFNFVNVLPKPTNVWAPTALSFDSSGDLHITDTFNNKIWRYRIGDGTFSSIDIRALRVGAFSLSSSTSSRTHKAYGMATDISGNAYIANTFGNSIQKFSPKGKLLMDFGIRGRGKVCFIHPRDIVVDPNGNIYVADTGNIRVQKFDNLGKFKTFFGVDKNWIGQIYRPRSVSVGDDGYLFVVSDKGKIFKYKIAVTLINGSLINPSFSPNGDGRKDISSFAFSLEEPVMLDCQVSDAVTSSKIRTIIKGKKLSSGRHSIAWDGKDTNGKIIADGEYLISLKAVALDKARESFPSEHLVVLDTIPPTAQNFRLVEPLVSPDNNGLKDNIEIRYVVSEEVFSLIQIFNEKGEVVDSLQSRLTTSEGEQIDFWPEIGEVRIIPDGIYKCNVILEDQAGNRTEYHQDFEVDLTPPEFQNLAISNPFFSPNNDERKDDTEVSFTLSEPDHFSRSNSQRAG